MIPAVERVRVFDRATAVARLGGDEELFTELAELFRHEAPQKLSELRDALARGDTATVHRVAHGLKGSSGYVGGHGVEAAAQRLEAIGAAGDLGAVPEALRALDDELQHLTAALAATTRP